MSEGDAPPAAKLPRPAGVRGWLLSGLAALALTIWLHAPVRQVLDPTLDTSNYASFAHFTAHGLQFGEDVLHVGGPYGFVHYGFVHGGSLYWKRLPLELLVKLVLSSLLVWYFRRADGGWLRWAWLALVLLFAPHVEDLPYDLAILLAGLCLIEVHLRPGRGNLLLGAALAAFLALLSLIKGTQAVLSFATFGLLLLQAALARDFRRVPVLVAAYGGALLVLLLLAGQDPRNFPRYLLSIYQQSAGYNVAMVIAEPRAAFLSGLGALLALAALILLVASRVWRLPAALTGAALFAGITFVEWKHGFVRADGHVFIFYHYAAIAAPMVLLYARPVLAPGRALRVTLGALAATAFALGMWADGPQAYYRHRHLVRETPSHLRASMREIFTPGATKRRWDAALAQARQEYALPEVRALVGAAPIDCFGTEHGFLTLNRLNYRPRPMGGGNFSVFNGWLQDVNVAHLTDPAKRPDFFLTRVEPFDDRLLPQDDAGTLRVLLAAYAPVATEQGHVLFARHGATTLPSPRLLESRRIGFDQMVEVPSVPAGEMLAFELDLQPTWRGRLRTFVYKPPVVYIDLEGTNLEHPAARRIVPTLVTRPVVLNPLLEQNRDLLEVYGGGPAKEVRRFRLTTSGPECYDRERLAVRFYAIPRPPPLAAEQLAALRAGLQFPTANRAPIEFTPPNAPLRRFDGLLVQMLEPPGRLAFALAAENEVSFQFGLDAEAYTDGATDGVEFFVELVRPGQPPQGLFHRWLRPRLDPADRGRHRQTLILPPYPPGSRLVLRTGPGQDGDGAWDWGWFSGIRLTGDAFRSEQFPGFARLPVQVEAAICGAFDHAGRRIFMLNAPGSLVFRLEGRERRLEFSGGLLPGAYTEGGQSDGVTYAVDVAEPGRAPRRVFSRHLAPALQESDRGSVAMVVDLPALPPGTELRLSTEPGPAGNGAWDWAFVDSLRLP